MNTEPVADKCDSSVAAVDVSDEKTSIETALHFLSTVFAEKDTILVRPIETWTEDERKRSFVDYKNTNYVVQHPLIMLSRLRAMLASTERNRTNLFLGVCPRFKNEGYDLAWQIRTVRALWADVDHVTVEEALDRVEKAGLPPPSIVVNSGNGVHLYWLLNKPYLIDDVGAPSPVFTQWNECSGKKVPRKFVVDGKDRLYLDQHKYLSRLSPKAEHIQDVIAGIAEAIGGDSTHDLARMLRIPGSLNRKNERNGREPIPTQLVQCDSDRRYQLADFEKFKTESTTTKRTRQVDAMPLPSVRKPSTAKQDKLSELIAASAIAEAGHRSEADFALCCFALRSGTAKDDVWSQVQNVGKFGERGEAYFNRTWSNAELEVRTSLLLKIESKNSSARSPDSPPVETSDENEPRNCVVKDKKPRIYIDASFNSVSQTLEQITDQLLRAGDCFSRADQLVCVYDCQISTVLDSNELAGLLNQHVEFVIVEHMKDDVRTTFQPLPSRYANTWLNQRLEKRRLPLIKLFTRNPVYAADWRLILPGYDAQSGIYNAGLAVAPRNGTEHIDRLLQGFCFQTKGDRTNFLGMLLTSVLMPHFIGSKPGLLLCANQPGLGKTILAQIIAILRDGSAAETATYNPNDEEFEKRLGAVVRRGATTIIVDNAKSTGRSPRIDSACLERSITDSILSFRLLGQSDTIRAENSHIFCITANSPEVSRDLITRCMVVNLYYEGDPALRTFPVDDPEGYVQEHRAEILGELLHMVETWKEAGQPRATTHTRFNKLGWGNIVGGILQVAEQPDFLLNASEAAGQLDEIKREFTELVALLVDQPKADWTAAELTTICDSNGLLKTQFGDGSPHSRATKMGTLGSRFVDERFLLDDHRQAVFNARDTRKGKKYFVSVSQSAEPLAVCRTSAEPHFEQGSAHLNPYG